MAKPPKVRPTVKSPERIAFPGIYDNPAKIAAEAASRVAPESPNLKRLFGVTRADLQDIVNSREGNLPGALPGAAANPRGSEAAEKIMTPKNVQRILDVNAEATKFPELVRGMDPWYVMDPFFKRMAELMGKEKAVEEYTRMNILSGMASPGSEVMTEIPRGSAAYFLNKQGRWNEFMDSMAIPQKGRKAAGVAEDIIGVPGHIYHRSAQAEPMEKYLKSGEFTMTTPKVPLYIESSGVPDTGFQTRTPVGDAHWSRAVGLGDTRTSKNFGASVSNPEMTQLAPWWREKIAEQLGIESVPAQARTWGAFSGQTGVTTPIGSPKLEMIADQIMDTARRLGVSPETARDLVMMGEARIGKADGGMVTSAPEEAIKNTITDPEAYRMLDMDLANLALMNQPQRMAGGGKMRIMHGSPVKIKPTNERPLHVTTDSLYATKRGSDKLGHLGLEGPPMVNSYDIPVEKLLRMDETPYTAEQVNQMRRYWNRLPVDTGMTGEEIYDLLSANKQPMDRLMPGITEAGGFWGYQRPATGTGGRDEWFKIIKPESLEVVKKHGGAVNMQDGGGTSKAQSIKNALLPVNMRQFVSHLTGDRSPITEAHMSPKDLDALRYAIEKNGGGKSGTISYGDYSPLGGSSFADPGEGWLDVIRNSYTDPAYRMETTLGQAAYRRLPDGSYVVEDRYNFNAPSKQYVDDELKKKNVISLMYDAYKKVGPSGVLNVLGNVYGDTEGESGAPVSIRLPSKKAEGGAVHPSPEEMLIELMERGYGRN